MSEDNEMALFAEVHRKLQSYEDEQFSEGLVQAADLNQDQIEALLCVRTRVPDDPFDSSAGLFSDSNRPINYVLESDKLQGHSRGTWLTVAEARKKPKVDYSQQTVEALRDTLRSMNLKVSGSKLDLEGRLRRVEEDSGVLGGDGPGYGTLRPGRLLASQAWGEDPFRDHATRVLISLASAESVVGRARRKIESLRIRSAPIGHTSPSQPLNSNVATTPPSYLRAEKIRVYMAKRRRRPLHYAKPSKVFLTDISGRWFGSGGVVLDKTTQGRAKKNHYQPIPAFYDPSTYGKLGAEFEDTWSRRIDLRPLASFERLSALSIHGDVDLACLGLLSGLKTLRLSEVMVGDAATLECLPELSQLTLTHCDLPDCVTTTRAEVLSYLSDPSAWSAKPSVEDE